ncbi:ATP--cobalamin adenosyltransferase (plasmid) [Xanthobacter versatilis]|uniref:Corrinoid adenosyltransferase n=1 Tax=Xanthobacter autotrophicus (strain ATCC BAA-1158 / Py2) TaxID=78245 RepID=A7IQC5_XANP2|nr:ATP--cobalamin adenosyltransferase [Xanthobacter autotrophicus Py2]
MSTLTAPSATAGDAGMTRLAIGTRVEKDSPTIELFGTLEELAAWIAVLADDPLSPEDRRILATVENDLHELLQQVAAPGTPLLSPPYVQRLDVLMDGMERRLPPAPSGAFPGGSPRAAFAAVARSVCRRAERRLVAQCDIDRGLPAASGIAYLNRLGDLLQQMARLANFGAGGASRSFDRGLSLADTKRLG